LEVLAGPSLQRPAPLKWISRVCLWADPRRDKLFLRLGFGSASLLRDLLPIVSAALSSSDRGGGLLTHEPIDLKSGETTR
jgi:hypothetical protein